MTAMFNININNTNTIKPDYYGSRTIKKEF